MKKIIKSLCDVEVVMGPTFIMPMFSLVKVAIQWFVTLVRVVKMCCANLYSFYYDPENIYIDLQFKNYTNLVDFTNDGLMTTWWINLFINIQYVIFYFQGH